MILPSGAVHTPCFMPVGTHGAVRGLSADEVRRAGAQIVLGNTYHLHLRPGEDVVRALGGLARFTGWNGPTLTDSASRRRKGGSVRPDSIIRRVYNRRRARFRSCR